MEPLSASDSPPRRPELSWADLLDRFDQARRSSPQVKIEDFLPAGLTEAARRRLLQELIKIDLECGWRQPAGGSPRILEDYVRRFPELGPLGQLSLDLIGEEYRARQRWGDRPAQTAYLARFAGHGQQLRELLQLLDAELAGEFAAKELKTNAFPSPLGLGPDDSWLHSLAPKRPLQPIATAAGLIDAIGRHRLLGPKQQEELPRLHKNFSEPRGLARELLQRGWLTAFQVNQLLQGCGADLLLGPYVLLERLGEGGAGQVFKAWHRKMNRMVALKVLRKELLAQPEVLGRFYREVQVLSQLSHPNIVRALDAGPIGPTHFLAMEFVEGIDLNRLVKKSGPLPLAQACDCIRQAACGLAHAHERGLVHRDIKPANLLLTDAASGGSTTRRLPLTIPQIKILDLGLARLPTLPACTGAVGQAGADSLTILTPQGAVLMMGTPDYLAPEQALDFHGTDIRADIYSLGCTFYFLLTGRAPFEGLTVPQKLLTHQRSEPPPIEKFRADVPPALVQLIRRMMAKLPEERYQTPEEVAAALAPYCGLTAQDRVPRQPGGPAIQPRPSKQTGRKRWRLAVGLGAAVAMVSLFVFLARSPSPSTNRARSSSGRVNSSVQVKTGASPFDGLDPKNIPAAARTPTMPLGLVAVFGKKGDKPAAPVAISPNGKWVAAAASEDRRPIYVWDSATGREHACLDRHKFRITKLAFSPDSKRLASGSNEKNLLLWDVAGREVERTFTGVNGGVGALAFSTDGNVLASGWEDKKVRLFEVATGRETQQPFDMGSSRAWSLAFAPDGRTLAIKAYSGPPQLWDYVTGRKKRDLAIKPRGLGGQDPQVIQFSPKGNELACSAGDPNTVQIWELGRTEPALTKLRRPRFTAGWLTYVANGKALAAASMSNGLLEYVLWDLSSQTVEQSGSIGDVQSVAFAPDGRHLAAGMKDGTVWIVRLK